MGKAAVVIPSLFLLPCFYKTVKVMYHINTTVSKTIYFFNL